MSSDLLAKGFDTISDFSGESFTMTNALRATDFSFANSSVQNSNEDKAAAAAFSMNEYLALEPGWDYHRAPRFTKEQINTTAGWMDYAVQFFFNKRNLEITKNFPAPISDGAIIVEFFVRGLERILVLSVAADGAQSYYSINS